MESSILSKVADLVLSPLLSLIWRHITYPCKAGDNTRALEKATRELLAKKNDVMEKVEMEERNGQRRSNQFQMWLEEVDDTKGEADKVVEKYNQRGMCFKCFSPNCSSNYSLGKAAAKTLLDVNKLLNDGRSQEVVNTPLPPAVQEMPVSTTLTSIHDPNLERVLGYIKEDDNVGMIGVWGIRGVGKTHLLKQINNSFVGDSSFNHVIFITVSQSCPISKIQKQIFKRLGIEKDEEDNNQSIIFNFLNMTSFLLLLDDLWDRVDLQKVGIPPLGVINGCKRKVVLTTLSSVVCGQMEASKTIKLECLDDDDAFNLFLEKVGEETINSHPSIRSLARNLVKELAGLPLDLINIGRAMSQKKEPKEWENAIERVKKSPLHELGESDDMRDLKNAIQNLLAKKKDLMEKVEVAERNGQVQTHQFQTWLKEVDDTKKEADEVVEKYKRKEFWPNYNFGEAAAKTLLDVKRLLTDERTPAVPDVVKTPVLPAVQEMPVSTTLTSIHDPNLERVLGYIREDDKAGMIGVWGIGKTRFLNQINNSFVGDSSFDHVIWITVSRSCPIAKVQKQIVESLSLPQNEDVPVQARTIFNFLKKRSFLLLLDDLWERIDLQEVGIPLPLGVVGGCKRKAVLTTRSLDVCGQMEVRKSIKLECLNYGDALNLFLEKVGEETINSHPSIRSLAGNMVKELGGLPLALITIGRAMHQKKEPREWEHAIKQVKNSEGLFHSLKISYDYLKDDTLRECFLSCSMWPEDASIDKDELINCWMGLGLIEDFDSMPEAYNCGYSLIGTLMAACLLEEDDEDDSFVRMHDLLHDMALWIAHDNGKSKNKWIVVEDEVPRDKTIWHTAEMIGIMNTEMEKLPPVADHPSKLTTLMLQFNDSLKELGDLRAFVALTYLDLSNCGFHNFPKEVCVLFQLQYLDLAYNSITSLPEELGSLVDLKFFILRGNRVDKIPQGVIAKLKYLQVLDLYNKYDYGTPNYLPSPLLEELESLNDLKGLGICVQGASQLRRLIELDNMPIWRLAISSLNDSTPFSLSASFLTDEKIQKNLSFLRITDSNVNQLVIESDHQHPTCHLSKLEQLRISSMPFLKEIIWAGVVPKQLFQGLRYFILDFCDMLKDVSWVLHLPHLNDLVVSNCSSMNQLIASEADDDSTPTFPCLKDIRLRNLPELVFICNSAFAFPALSSLHARGCPKLKKLPFQAENIPSKLQTISGGKEWLNGLEWEDSGVKTRLHNFFEVIDSYDYESGDGDDESGEGDSLAVTRLLNDDERRTQEVAITPVPPAIQEMPVLTTSTYIRYDDPNLGTVLGYIREDDKAGMIGVWGMGGVGKTRFLKQINNSFVGDSSFDHVIWITVSRPCPIAKVQKQIVESLAIQKGKDDNSQSNIIFNFLQKRSFLFLLDDVWERIDLEKVGIPPLGVINGCKRKAVLTTRSLDVCGQMDVRKPIKLECLNDEDAFNLFSEKVGKETINSHPSIRSLAGNMVKELGGLPLALITIGRAMYQKKEPKEWEHAIKQVKKSQLHKLESSHENQSEGLFPILKISYDSLKSDTLRKCFLSCSMWPEDASIDKDELIDCWMGLDLIEDFDSMPEAYNCGYSLIGTLMAACLLEEDDEDDSFVRMHDLLHDMALWIAHDNGKSKNKWIVAEDEVPRDKTIWHTAEMIGIMNTEMEKLPPVADYPAKLTTLMLRSNDSLKELGDLRAFVALTYLDLSNCGFHNFPKEVCVLFQLQYLDLAYNSITSLPEELGSLVDLKFFILRGNRVDKIPQGVIAKLKYLQVLDLYNKYDYGTPNYLPSPLLEELESLNDLKGLGICVQGASQLRRLIELDNMPIWCLAISSLNDSTPFSLSASFLTEEKIRNNLSVLNIMHSNVNQLVIESDHQHPTCQLSKLEQLLFYEMPCLKEIIWEGVFPKQLFQGLRFFYLHSCDMLKDISWVLHLPHLRKLDVYCCSSINQLIIASEADDDSTPTFPCLKEIVLDNLPKLVAICHSAFAFPSLSSLRVLACPKLKKLPFQAENIPSKLQTISGGKEWLNGLELEDSGVKTRLQNFFEVIDSYDYESGDGDYESADGDDESGDWDYESSDGDDENGDGDDESEKASLI